nr:hypothetical protein CFP56_66342 [Quercus suber]
MLSRHSQLEERANRPEGVGQAGMPVTGDSFIAITKFARGERDRVCQEEVKVKVLPDVDKYFQIGEGLKDEDKVEMLLLLVQNVDVFT